jgi:quercetin dioxygenase-like cupin family protein
VEIIRREEVGSFANGGVTSEQLLFPENSRSQRVTITRVTVAPGAKNPPHAHAASEQVWVALRGSGLLLLGGCRNCAIRGRRCCALCGGRRPWP